VSHTAYKLHAKLMFNEIPYVRSLSLYDLLTRYDEDETRHQAAHT